MTWQEARTRFPDQWVLWITIQGHVDGDFWCVTELAVVSAYDDPYEMMRAYKELRQRMQGQEVGFFHASHEQIRIEMRTAFPIRPGRVQPEQETTL